MKSVLVVDDDKILRETLRDILLFNGFVVSEACDGSTAIDLLFGNKYDLVITDILMPERDGFDVIAESKKRGTMVLAISGGGFISSELYLRMASELGADDVISKPFDVDNLLNKIQGLVGLSYPE
jgi:DNA-binding response OmpR family regulator